jgi:hypothetical protein
MGTSRYDDHIYASRISTAKATGADLFTHDADIRTGKVAAGVSNLLDPMKTNKAGKNIRESLDSAIAPNSRAVAVFFDETGSMSTVPRVFVLKLQKLMASLVKKGFIPDPHVLFGGVGDAKSDRVPLQVGQFEGGNEIDDALTSIYLEGGGGGGEPQESYELALYYIARHTDVDCIKKRGQKGYLFILGDERPYSVVSKKEVERLIGDTLEADIPVEDIVKEVQKNWNLFWIIPGGTSHFDDNHVIVPMRKLLGQNYIKMENPDDVCEVIVSTIGLTEGYDLHDVGAALKDVGADPDAIKRATAALVPYAKTAAVAKVATVSGALVEAGSDAVDRL